MDAATLTIQIINLLGLCGLGWLIYTLKNAVAAQKNTIDAQEAHIKSMASVVSMLDAPAMAQRFKSFRELVETEKVEWMKAAERKFEEEKNALTQSSAQVDEKLNRLMMMYSHQSAAHIQAVSLLAVNFKFHPLDWELLKNSLPQELRDRIEELMSLIPMPVPSVPPPPPSPPRTSITPPDPNATE
jgi:hypothetical protein